jgi:hypothetical protein
MAAIQSSEENQAVPLEREVARILNPFIGANATETMSNVASAVEAAAMFGAGDMGEASEEIAWARSAFSDTAARALRWEAGHG